MKWEEIDYFLGIFEFFEESRILDVWCGNGRFLWALKNVFPDLEKKHYSWIDSSTWLLAEARKLHSKFWDSFEELNMLNISSLDEKFTDMFFIASYHHLDDLSSREEVLKKAFGMLKEWWKIYLTNWALNSELNAQKYKKSIIADSKNSYWSIDYNIKIWDSTRYYHCFSLDELEYLAQKSWLKIIENRLFDNQRNLITILQK